MSTVRRIDGGDRWRDIRFVVFDAPSHDGPFEERLEAVRRIVDPLDHATRLPHARCEGIAHLRAELFRVEALGGEGLMLRQPGSRYEIGRSSTLLKVKSFFDAEARVIGHEAGAGRHQGRLGSLLVETPEGIRFNVGTGLSDAERAAPPPIGSIVTYRYQELSRDRVPRFPSFVGVRIDAVWPEARPKAARTAAARPTTPPPGADGSLRRFEFDDGSSRKFWAVAQDGASFTVTYGRLGTNGQSKTKVASSEEAASAEVAKLIAEKLSKGYAEAEPAPS